MCLKGHGTRVSGLPVPLACVGLSHHGLSHVPAVPDRPFNPGHSLDAASVDPPLDVKRVLKSTKRVHLEREQVTSTLTAPSRFQM